jgi:transcriptional regulator with GAF, ATPase, and Fis domain
VLVAAPNARFLKDTFPAEAGLVETAAGGAEALAMLEGRRYSSVLLDRRLPDLDSQEVFTIIRTRYPHLEILWIDSENGAPDADRLERPPAAPLPNIIGATPVMRELARMARLVARRKTSVLLTGETGTGKELLARAIHQISQRALAPFVVVNCAAIPEELLEAELFGYSRGAFTGAYHSRPGRLQAAHGGVLFFDEIGELPPAMQAKLLRFLQDGEIQRLGSLEVQHVDVRVIAATNTPLPPKVASGDFREDLYYRIAAFPLHLPPLRERVADIGLIARHYLDALCREYKLPRQWLSPPAAAFLEEHTWPGNVRELEHALERASILADGGLELRPEHFVAVLPSRIGP